MRRALATAILGVLMISAGLAAPAAGDHQYHQEASILWETNELDVQVVGIEDPLFGNAIHHAIHAWRTGIENASTSGPVDDLVIRDYVPGADVQPPHGFEPEDVEIAIVPQGTMAVYPYNAPFVPDDGAATLAGVRGVGPLAPECVAFAPRAYDVNEVNWTYRVAAHEFGHCLGLGHSYNHSEAYEPDRDIMGNGFENRSCPSNLNIQVLEHAFRGDDVNVTVDTADYEQVECDTGEPSLPTTLASRLTLFHVPASTPEPP